MMRGSRIPPLYAVAAALSGAVAAALWSGDSLVFVPLAVATFCAVWWVLDRLARRYDD